MSAFEQIQHIKKANITSIPFSALSEYIYHTNIVHFPNIVIATCYLLSDIPK